MKRLTFTFLSAVLLFATLIKASAQQTENRNVSGYHAVASSGSFNVHINIDGTESLKISANSEIISEIETVVKDGELQIKFKNHYEWSHSNVGRERIDIYVSAKSLNSITNSGSGSMKVDGQISGDKAAVTLSGSGDINTAVKSGSLNARISGSGSVHLNGSTGDADFKISGSGQIEAKELKAQSVSVGISGSGNVYVSADKSVSAHISGSGNVEYSGNASVVDTKFTGSGRVNKVD
jgi:hypothetical protein